MARATTKAKAVEAEAAPQPTFASCELKYWSATTNKPWTPKLDELDDSWSRSDAEAELAALEEWLRVQQDASELGIRQAYAAHIARYLVGLFPSARVNGEAFALAAGEELGCFSADIVRLIGLRARKLKSLPTLGILIEFAEEENGRRRQQLDAYWKAFAAYSDAKAKAKLQAETLAYEAARAIAPCEFEAAAFHELWRIIVGTPTLGICDSSMNGRRRVAIANALLKRICDGEDRALHYALQILRYNQAAMFQDEAMQHSLPDMWTVQEEQLAQLPAFLGLPRLECWPEDCSPDVKWDAVVSPIGVEEGQRIYHWKYGHGTVLIPCDPLAIISFESAGKKRVFTGFLSVE
ncbi:hypothetical protein JMJ56_25695 [Belnapia sp. T18]|uniref:Uncharacterized protein n=1 Tax=Belnapia arida TaxID=2804533 RepID=A0ABS1U9M4_9PROT|nr:hypothetical protein [Belnapia arida]MBL6081394.1 hypothetical protein [Belnapia arida]